MITDKDITKLEKVFVTKEDFKQGLEAYPTKVDLKNELSKYPTKVDLKNELSKYATKDEMKKAFEENTAIIVKEIRTIVDIIGEISSKLDKRTSDHDDILDHHQIQIDNLNNKVFPTA